MNISLVDKCVHVNESIVDLKIGVKYNDYIASLYPTLFKIEVVKEKKPTATKPSKPTVIEDIKEDIKEEKLDTKEELLTEDSSEVTVQIEEK